MHRTHRASRPAVVLIANDREIEVRSLESVLGPRGYAVIRADTGERALELSYSARPDALILDSNLSDISGVEICAQLHEDPRFPPTVPIIITTPDSNYRHQRLHAYEVGAWEFCAQPLDMDILLPKLDAFTRAKLASDRVRDEGLIDFETGLYNLRGLARRTREIGSDVMRRREALSCIAFSARPESSSDPSESGGADDAAFAERVSAACTRCTRISDAVGRLGPAEYVIVAPQSAPENAALIVQRLRDELETRGVQVGGVARGIRLNVAVSAATDLGEAAGDALDLLNAATTSLRQQTDAAAPYRRSGDFGRPAHRST